MLVGYSFEMLFKHFYIDNWRTGLSLKIKFANFEWENHVFHVLQGQTQNLFSISANKLAFGDKDNHLIDHWYKYLKNNSVTKIYFWRTPAKHLWSKINPFQPNVLFLYPPKTLENQGFSERYSGVVEMEYLLSECVEIEYWAKVS